MIRHMYSAVIMGLGLISLLSALGLWLAVGDTPAFARVTYILYYVGLACILTGGWTYVVRFRQFKNRFGLCPSLKNRSVAKEAQPLLDAEFLRLKRAAKVAFDAKDAAAALPVTDGPSVNAKDAALTAAKKQVKRAKKDFWVAVQLAKEFGFGAPTSIELRPTDMMY